MGTFGPAAPPPRQENLFKRIFWPANRPFEADSLGQQGLWVCLLVAVVWAVFDAAAKHPLLGLLVLAFYWTGGMGVRQHSVSAAVIVFAGYVCSVVMALLLGNPLGVLDVIVSALLLANIRGTAIAARWKRLGEPEIFPQRLNATLTDKLIDRWPARFWPKGRFLFFAVALVYGGLFLLGAIGTLRAPQRPQPQEIQLQVTPPTR